MSSERHLDEPVLILNVTFEPIHVCSTKRALALVFSGKAEIVLNGRGAIRTAASAFELPSVIKLSHMVRRPRQPIALSKREILRRDDYTCQYCGRKMRTLTLDHVVPRRLGGPHTWTNLVAACSSCNRRKGGKHAYEVNMALRRAPFEPPPTASYRFGSLLEQRQEWAQYIEGW